LFDFSTPDAPTFSLLKALESNASIVGRNDRDSTYFLTYVFLIIILLGEYYCGLGVTKPFGFLFPWSS